MNTGLDDRLTLYTDTTPTVCKRDLNIQTGGDGCSSTTQTSIGTDHNHLTGLQGGLPTERYHLDKDSYDGIIAANDLTADNPVATMADLPNAVDPTQFIQNQGNTIQEAQFSINGAGQFKTDDSNYVSINPSAVVSSYNNGSWSLDNGGYSLNGQASMSLSTNGLNANNSSGNFNLSVNQVGANVNNQGNWTLSTSGLNVSTFGGSGSTTVAVSSSAVNISSSGSSGFASVSLQPQGLSLTYVPNGPAQTVSLTPNGISLSNAGSVFLGSPNSLTMSSNGGNRVVNISPSSFTIADITNVNNSFSINLQSGYAQMNANSGNYIYVNSSPFRVVNTPTNDEDVLRKMDTAIFQAALTGKRNQQIFISQDDTSHTILDNQILEGQFITNDAERDRAFIRGQASQAQIFNSFGRFVHGFTTDANPGGFTNSNVIPGYPPHSNSWSYDSGTNKIESTYNTGPTIGFYSKDKYDSYIHEATLSAADGDNDSIGLVIAFVEDTTQMVTNNAFGLNPADYNWPIDVTSGTIPNQHTLSVFRRRDNPANTWFLVYNQGKADSSVIINNSNAVGLYQNASLAGWTGVTTKVKVNRQGDIITLQCTNFSDAPGGEGDYGYDIVIDLNSDSRLTKFKGKQGYGYAAQSQAHAAFTNISFSGSTNVVYDLRNGLTYVFGSSGFVPDNTRSYYNDIGYNRLLSNPYEGKLLAVRTDKTINTISRPTYLGTVDDSGGILTSAALDAFYPNSLQGNQAVSATRVYQKNISGWFYFSKTDCS